MLALFIRALLVASSRSLCCAHEKVIQEKVDLIVTRPKPDRRTFVMANGGNRVILVNMPQKVGINMILVNMPQTVGIPEAR